MPLKQQPSRDRDHDKDGLRPILSDDIEQVSELFRKVIKRYLGVPIEGNSSKIRQAQLQKLIVSALENNKLNDANDEE